MTKKMALENALTVLESRIAFLSETDSTADATEAAALRATVETIEKMITQLSASPEAKAKANEARKAKTAQARAELVAKVAPVLREALIAPVTAKELFEATKGELPADFTARRVQEVLLREMKPELIITEAKGKANTYQLKA